MGYIHEYTCPHCGAVLNHQTGFDPKKETWICKSCGQLVYSNDVYDGEFFPGVMWYCDICGELLNKQKGFSDNCRTWKCRKCGYVNSINNDEILNPKRNNDVFLNEPDTQEDEYADTDDFLFDDEQEDEVPTVDPETAAAVVNGIMNGVSAYSNYKKAQEERRLEEIRIENEKQKKLEAEEQRKKEKAQIKRAKRVKFYKAHWKLFSIIMLILFMSAFGFYKYKEYSRSITIGVSSNELVGISYPKAVRILENNGFTNVIAVAVEDLDAYDLPEEGIVSEVSVKGKTTFDDNFRCPYDAEINVVYHAAKKMVVPISAKEAKKLDYNEVLNQFRNAGFENIILIPKSDVVIGLLAKEDAVESVSVNGDTDFKQGDEYRLDVEIIIEYHTKK